MNALHVLMTDEYEILIYHAPRHYLNYSRFLFLSLSLSLSLSLLSVMFASSVRNDAHRYDDSLVGITTIVCQRDDDLRVVLF
jgi:hypothetical protein